MAEREIVLPPVGMSKVVKSPLLTVISGEKRTFCSETDNKTLKILDKTGQNVVK